MELISVLQGADNIVGLMGSEICVTWSGSEVSYTDFKRKIVALDYGPIMGKGTPFAGAKVDEVIGYAAHEGGHCLWSEPDKPQNIYLSMELVRATLSQALKRAWNEGNNHTVDDGEGGTINPVLIELCRIQNILDDSYIDHRVAKQWEVLGEHIHISRQKLQERRPFDFEAITQTAHYRP